jgi:N-acetyl-anhydromuramyl-L-alanine amidase AmpD
VVLWTDPGGYDAYRTEKRFVPYDKAAWAPPQGGGGGGGAGGAETPNRYGLRFARDPSKLPPDLLEQVRGGGWDLPALQDRIDQFVIHYDAAGTSRQCFKVLHDLRGLSIHFMLDLDGTIYQTLDVKERAWHATTSNDRSVGIEIANIGAYRFPPSQREGAGVRVRPPAGDGPETGVALPPPLADWYTTDPAGCTILTLPAHLGDGGLRTLNFVPRPARPHPVTGDIQGRTYVQYDLTPQQYDSLIKLTATLCTVFPNIPCDHPRDPDGGLILHKIEDAALAEYRGLLGHYHIQDNKVDPGPAFDWDRVITGARRLMH